ncbi:Uncharacterised protein [uncultured archaeon]|nr:Uncharacterised protein [uncultured archaeon]
MKSKSGAILIGLYHHGIENARAVVAELEKKGLQKGDIVAIEFSLYDMENLMVNVNGGYGTKIQLLAAEIQKNDRAIQSLEEQWTFGQRLMNLYRKSVRLKDSMGDLVFINEVIGFIVKRGANIVGFDSSFARKKLGKTIIEQEKKSAEGRQITKKEHNFFRFLIGPAREKIMAKRLLALKPKFVLAGAMHIDQLKKAIPFKETIIIRQGTAKLEGIARLVETADLAIIRARYKSHRALKRPRNFARRAVAAIKITAATR